MSIGDENQARRDQDHELEAHPQRISIPLMNNPIMM
jgi:hypothetical protein